MSYKHLNKYIDDDFLYVEAIDFWINDFEHFYALKNTEIAINTSIYNSDWVFEEYGVEKGVYMLAAFLFCMKHNDIPAGIACEAYMTIQDFNTGEYDYLLGEENIKEMKKDIEKISKELEKYFKEHPELIED